MENVATYYLDVLARLKMLHWFTNNYTMHLRFGDLYDQLSVEVDGLIETLQSSKGRIPSPPLLQTNWRYLLESTARFTQKLERRETRASVDNIVHILSKYMYLFTMK